MHWPSWDTLSVPLGPREQEMVSGSSPMVGIEAAAGAGKTHLACELATEWAKDVRPYQSVLFLSHTNAARDVFRRRVATIGGISERVELKTLDAFCLDLLSPYAGLWDLPVPLVPPRPLPAGWFVEMRRKAARLLQAKPSITSAVVARFPLVIADEHQDASRHHHMVLKHMADAGARVRMLGDALQAILTFDPTIPGWDALMGGLPVVSLVGSWRWTDAPDLGEWIVQARMRLLRQLPVQLSGVPPCVEVVVIDQEPGAPWPTSRAVHEVLRRHIEDRELLVLGRRNDDVNEIARAPDLRLVVNEGSDLRTAEQVLEEALAAAGDPRRVAAALADFMIGAGTLSSPSAAAIRSLHAGNGPKSLRDIIDSVRRQPDLSGLISATRSAIRGRREIGWEILHPQAVQAVARIPVSAEPSEVRDLAYEAQRVASESPVPARCSSTVHKAKGREFEHVIIPCLDSSTFRGILPDRQLLYVGLSRARRRLTLIVPRNDPTPLVEL